MDFFNKRVFGKKNGFSLLEVVLVLAVVALAMRGTVWMANAYSTSIKNDATARYQKTVIEAGEKYIRDNSAALIAAATPTVPAQINITDLITGSYLPSGFSATNPYGQTTCIKVLEPSANVLAGLVISNGGVSIPDVDLYAIAAATGSKGGYIEQASATTARGAYGGWSVATTNYLDCAGAATTSGHLSGSLFLNNSQILGDYLYRSAVPGHPEANTMATDINMGGNSVSAANNVSATGSLTVTSANGSTAVVTGSGNDPRLALTNAATGTTVGASTVTGLTAVDPATGASLFLGTPGLTINLPGQKYVTMAPGVGLDATNIATGTYGRIGNTGVATTGSVSGSSATINGNVTINNSNPGCSSAAPWACSGLYVNGGAATGGNYTYVGPEEFAQVNATTGQWAGAYSQQVKLNTATKGAACALQGQTSLNIADTTETLVCSGGLTWVSQTVAPHGTQLYQNPGWYAFVVPQGVTAVDVYAIGGGGGGGGCSCWGGGGGGGGGGGHSYAHVAVTPGVTYSVTVGYGGGAGAAGQQTNFSGLVIANGGGAGGTAPAAMNVGGVAGIGGWGNGNSGSNGTAWVYAAYPAWQYAGNGGSNGVPVGGMLAWTRYVPSNGGASRADAVLAEATAGVYGAGGGGARAGYNCLGGGWIAGGLAAAGGGGVMLIVW